MSLVGSSSVQGPRSAYAVATTRRSESKSEPQSQMPVLETAAATVYARQQQAAALPAVVQTACEAPAGVAEIVLEECDVDAALLVSLFSSVPLGTTRFVSLNHNRVRELPLPFLQRIASSVRVLSVAHNRMEVLPRALQSLRRVQCLYLSHNRIAELFPELSDLPDLEALFVDHNLLVTLDGLAPSLTEIDASFNRISVLSLELFHLTALRVLNLSGNCLHELTQAIGYCTALEELRLDDNTLVTLPYELSLLTRLRVLSLRNNQLRIVHPELIALRDLAELNLEGNPIVFPPKDALKGGVVGLMDRLSEFDRATALMLRACEGTLPPQYVLELQHFLETAPAHTVLQCQRDARRLYELAWSQDSFGSDLPVELSKYQLAFGMQGQAAPLHCLLLDSVLVVNTLRTPVSFSVSHIPLEAGVSLRIVPQSGVIEPRMSADIRFELEFSQHARFRQAVMLQLNTSRVAPRVTYIHADIESQPDPAPTDIDTAVMRADIDFIGARLASGQHIHIFRGAWASQQVLVTSFAIKHGSGSPDAESEDELALDPGFQAMTEAFQTELNALMHVQHPRVLPLLAATVREPFPCLVYPYPTRGNLSVLVQTRLPWETRLHLARDALWGLLYLHRSLYAEHGMPTRELKATAFMVAQDWTTLVADTRLSPSGWGSSHHVSRLCNCCFTAPEILMGEPFTAKTDSFNFGVVLFEIFVGRKPLWAESDHELDAFKKPILDDSRGYLPKFPAPYQDLIEKCWSWRAADRPDLDEILFQMAEHATAPEKTVTRSVHVHVTESFLGPELGSPASASRTRTSMGGSPDTATRKKQSIFVSDRKTPAGKTRRASLGGGTLSPSPSRSRTAAPGTPGAEGSPVRGPPPQLRGSALRTPTSPSKYRKETAKAFVDSLMTPPARTRPMSPSAMTRPSAKRTTPPIPAKSPHSAPRTAASRVAAAEASPTKPRTPKSKKGVSGFMGGT